MKSRRAVGRIVVALGILGFLAWTTAGAQTQSKGEAIVHKTCTQCHRIAGEPTARRLKQAPDLIWAGDKYQRKWLVGWLQNPKFKFYPMGYDFRDDRRGPHHRLSTADAEAVADFLGTLHDPRVKQGVMVNITPANVARGKARYEVLQCFACHRTPASNPQGYSGGDTSTDLRESGKRYQGDWLHRFNSNPLDFVPDSAAFIPSPAQNVTERDVFDITAYMLTFQ